jgi:hypothetical protein
MPCCALRGLAVPTRVPLPDDHFALVQGGHENRDVVHVCLKTVEQNSM